MELWSYGVMELWSYGKLKIKVDVNLELWTWM